MTLRQMLRDVITWASNISFGKIQDGGLAKVCALCMLSNFIFGQFTYRRASSKFRISLYALY